MSVCTEYYSTNVLRNKQAVMSCPYRVLQYVGTKETCSPLIDPSTLVRKSFMLVREV